MINLKSDFNMEFSNKHCLLIRDRSAIEQKMSITNDAENVVVFLYNLNFLSKNTELYYIDTTGRVDILEHDGQGKFTGFKPGYENEDEFYNSFGGQK